MLAADAILYSDGGGVVTAARKPIYGAAKCARFLVGIRRKLGYEPEYRFVRVNGDPGVRIHGPAGVVSVMAFEIADGARRQRPHRQQPGEADPGVAGLLERVVERDRRQRPRGSSMWSPNRRCRTGARG